MSRRVLLTAAAVVLAALPPTFGRFSHNMALTGLRFSPAVLRGNLLTGMIGLLAC